MTKTISIHDNYLIEYTVNSETKEITFKTEFRDKPQIEKTDIIFRGVIGYQFQFDGFNSILYDIEDIDPNELLKDNLDYIKEAIRMSGAFGELSGTLEESRTFFQKNDIKGYCVVSSIGIDGWIFAKSKEYILRN